VCLGTLAIAALRLPALRLLLIEHAVFLFTLFTLFTLLAYLNYTPRLRYKHEDQIHYSRTRFVARAPSRIPTRAVYAVHMPGAKTCMPADDRHPRAPRA